ncbi:DNA recombination protein RmuC [Coralloluteibacterium stylophorae]|uniref:DNA recombination protein RmuC n=1 Tax=Coralloluteibacterium stylophorae TaxID=1776034 RepID=A0AAP2C9E7_9GAMM|nr:DNA recombination protein RmuC [Coralloluteibacterium stylophorae]MBS7455875.1 DNA recombination protein RmuC [Coralloluteibacterium stylophorae]
MSPVPLAILAFLAGSVLAAVVLLPLLRARALAAREQGRRDREPDVATLAAGREAFERQHEEARAQLRDRDAEIAELRTRLERSGIELAGAQARLQRMDAVARQLDAAQAELREQATALRGATAQRAELAARLEEQKAAADERLRELEQARARMTHEFKALAAEILEDKSKRFSEQNSAQIGQLLGPLREQIGDFRKLVSDSYDKENKDRAALQTELKQLLDLNRRLSDEAHSLTRALTTENRTQGYWGELKLERLLESAGLEKGTHYLTQESFRDGEGDRYRPDAIVLLPGDRHIVIDAKMNLVDYQRACEEDDPEARAACMARHALAMRTHVRQLGDKDYSRLEGLQSPDLVLMFVPIEAAFLEAVRADTSLYDTAFKQKIILVGPGNLLASLKLIGQIWRTEDQNRNAKAISDRAAALYDKFVGFVEDLDRIGDALGRAQKAQQDALGKLTQGRGNLVGQVEKLRRLGAAPKKQLAQPLLDAVGDDADGDADE